MSMKKRMMSRLSVKLQAHALMASPSIQMTETGIEITKHGACHSFLKRPPDAMEKMYVKR
jgi:hypothetical protein